MVLQFFGLEICVPDLVWTLFDFFILFVLLKIFLFRPLLSFMEKRDARIMEGLRAGEEAQQKILEAKEQGREEIIQSRKQAVDLISEARKETKEMHEENLAEARVRAGELREEIGEKLACEREETQKLLSGNVPEYAAILAARLLHVETRESYRAYLLDKAASNRLAGNNTE